MESKNYLLVGGAGGIGRATAGLLRAAGHRLCIATRNPGDCEDAVSWDATTEEPVPGIPETLHGLVYFPGTVRLKPFQRLTLDEFRHDLDVNLFGAIRVLQQALPALKRPESASVVLFSSVAAAVGLPMHASIAAAKAAVEGLARSLAAEWAPAIRVNVIAPSLTDTPLVAGLLPDETRRQAAAQRHPLKRIGTAEDCARLAVFLLGEEARFLTGQILRPDGGLSSLRGL